ncbi:hypothetical protein [Burkholderia multivorans]|uniref:hypothetical protein n=1 Tax=Burkholderia multivorans TaxID=87883 RepID=UPI0020B21774|nr:hypothetical protein [Burkholderia multivorans]MCA8312711.1 hypothetical protein [Burkholderia multivorans]
MIRGSSGIGGAPMRLVAREADDEPARYRARLDSRRTREAGAARSGITLPVVETMGADDRQAPAQPAGGSCIR